MLVLNLHMNLSLIFISHCLIPTGDILLIANETGLNITDIQEALLNLTSVTDLLRPGKLNKLFWLV